MKQIKDKVELDKEHPNYRIKITKQHLENYLGDELKRCNQDIFLSVCMLEHTFGYNIFRQIDGFINFAKENNLSEFQIKTTLLHDVGGALNSDTLMLPRVSDYGKYSTIKKLDVSKLKNHI